MSADARRKINPKRPFLGPQIDRQENMTVLFLPHFITFSSNKACISCHIWGGLKTAAAGVEKKINISSVAAENTRKIGFQK